MPPSLAAAAERVAKLWARPGTAGAPPVILLCGEAESSKRSVAAAACARLGLGLHPVRAEDLPAGPSEREAVATLIDREWRARLRARLLLECDP